ncbi:MAG: BMC domain-containing protein [Deltaproteobacteria bacterium]|nr:BMC domain-containing protein [Deltaproteobacteria bacterium]
MSGDAPRSALEAVAVVETASIARGFVVLDAIAKKAPVTVKRAAPVSPGKFVLLFGGELEATRESHQAALEVAGSNLVDELFLPGAHAALLPAIDAAIAVAPGDAVAIVEMSTVASAVLAADLALKAVNVAVLRLHLAVGVGGKGWFSLAGALADVEAALGAVRAGSREDRLVAVELIAQPHGEIRGFLS